MGFGGHRHFGVRLCAMNGIMSAYSFVAWGRPAAKWPLRIANLLAFAASLVAIVCFAATKNFSAGGNADTLWKLYLRHSPDPIGLGVRGNFQHELGKVVQTLT